MVIKTDLHPTLYCNLNTNIFIVRALKSVLIKKNSKHESPAEWIIVLQNTNTGQTPINLP